LQVAANIKRAVQKVLSEGLVRTRDLGGKSTTTEMTQAILDKLLKED
jgi:isocitrate/isopropylmalate dehydrogenase